MKTDKQFDCVEMKRHAAARIHARLKGKTISQRLAYWEARSKAMQRRKSKAA